jgi:hypothetical protein
MTSRQDQPSAKIYASSVTDLGLLHGRQAKPATFDLLIQNRHRLVATLMWWYFE